jgi:hypothetical protein
MFRNTVNKASKYIEPSTKCLHNFVNCGTRGSLGNMYLHLLNLILKRHDLQLHACIILKRLRKTTKGCQDSQSPDWDRPCRLQTSINSWKNMCMGVSAFVSFPKRHKYFYCEEGQKKKISRIVLHCLSSFPAPSLLYPHSSNPLAGLLVLH